MYIHISAHFTQGSGREEIDSYRLNCVHILVVGKMLQTSALIAPIVIGPLDLSFKCNLVVSFVAFVLLLCHSPEGCIYTRDPKTYSIINYASLH